MGMITKYLRSPLKAGGPSGGELLSCSFTTSGTTADVTTNEAQGCTVARTGVGVFVITTRKTFKHIMAVISPIASTTAQQFVVTARTTNSITITQVTAGGGTAVDTLAATVHVLMLCRANS